jgi:hypothetical protein
LANANSVSESVAYSIPFPGKEEAMRSQKSGYSLREISVNIKTCDIFLAPESHWLGKGPSVLLCVRRCGENPFHHAVFPIAGIGTYCLPATKVVPKQMLPMVEVMVPPLKRTLKKSLI